MGGGSGGQWEGSGCGGVKVDVKEELGGGWGGWGRGQGGCERRIEVFVKIQKKIWGGGSGGGGLGSVGGGGSGEGSGWM